MDYTKVEKLMDNERHRWSYMDQRQMLTRLNRITKEEKLECFARLAREHNNDYLYQRCKQRRDELFSNSTYEWGNTFEL